MELELLISEICGKVKERMEALEQSEAKCSDKPRLFLISQDHGTLCHPTLESRELLEYYCVDCMLLQDKTLESAPYEGVIAYTLTNEALGKLANGIFDTDYTRAFGKALLLGKRIFVPEEEVELYRYRDTAPEGYYNRLAENLKFLENNGVTIVPDCELIQTILGGQTRNEESAKPEKAQKPEKIVHLTKKVITERDMIAAREEQASCVTVEPKAILTDLAKEYGRRYHIKLERKQG